MKKIQKLKAKKGFTLVEMIVVIAIIGVLLMLIVPALTSSDVPSAGKGYAKDFYYAAQNFASRQRLSGTGTLSGDGISSLNYIILYADVAAGEKGQITDEDCGLAVKGVGQSKLADMTHADQIAFVDSFRRTMNERLTDTAYDGTFYAVIDDHYRISATYWTDGGWDEVDSQSFTDNCVLSTGVYACSFPTQFCMPVDAAGETVFDV